MAPKKKSKDCNHDWRGTSSTNTHWVGLGRGTRYFRACKLCAKIDWLEFVPDDQDVVEYPPSG